MDVFSKDELSVLLAPQAGSCVSIYMPGQKVSDIEQNRIRLKNLLREAEERLAATGLRGPEARALLQPVANLLREGASWNLRSEGLALFVARDLFRYYRLPLSFKELVVVSDRFHIRPLLPLLTSDGRFFVLALSQKDVRLLECSHYTLREVQLPETIPSSLADFMKWEIQDREQQFHAHTGPRTRAEEVVIAHTQSHLDSGETGIGPLMSHGDALSQVHKENMLRHFQAVDRGLRHMAFSEETAPLVLSGVDYLLPIYREANTYRYLADEGIPGNPDDITSDVLHRRGWKLVRPYFDGALEGGAAQYRQLAGTGHTSKDVAEVVPLAYHGKVAFLITAVGMERWGRFDPATGKVLLHASAEPGDEDMLDLAAAHTLAHKGMVFAVPTDKVPDGPPLAAVLRIFSEVSKPLGE